MCDIFLKDSMTKHNILNLCGGAMQQGRFIVFEGGDGSGKSTCMQYIRRELGDEHIVYVREPGGTPLGEGIRKILLMGEAMDPVAELLLFFASRAEHIVRVIEPALRAGKHVLCDRFAMSSYAYQVVGRECPELKGLYDDLYSRVVAPRVTPYYIYLDIDPRVTLERVVGENGSKKTRFDNEALSFHNRVREGYRTRLATMPEDMYVSIDVTNKSSEEVKEIALREVRRIIKV